MLLFYHFFFFTPNSPLHKISFFFLLIISLKLTPRVNNRHRCIILHSLQTDLLEQSPLLKWKNLVHEPPANYLWKLISRYAWPLIGMVDCSMRLNTADPSPQAPYSSFLMAPFINGSSRSNQEVKKWTWWNAMALLRHSI